MRVNRFASTIVLVLMMTGLSFAEPFRMGLGISVDDDHGTLYFPIEKGHYIVEPMIYALWSERDEDGMGLLTQRGLTSSESIESRELNLSMDQKRYRAGIGFFRIFDFKEKVRMLAGMRVGYQLQKRETDTKTVDSSYHYLSSTKEELDGLFFEPLVSLEYAVTGHVSLGGSISVVYSRLTGTDQRTDQSVSDSGSFSESRQDMDATESASSTETALYVKYYF